MARTPMFNAIQVQRMKDAYVLEKQPLTKIASEFGVSVPTIAKYLRNADVELRGRGRPQGSKNVPKAKVLEAVKVDEPDQLGTGEAEVVNYDPPEVEEVGKGTDPVNQTPFRW